MRLGALDKVCAIRSTSAANAWTYSGRTPGSGRMSHLGAQHRDESRWLQRTASKPAVENIGMRNSRMQRFRQMKITGAVEAADASEQHRDPRHEKRRTQDAPGGGIERTRCANAQD